ncbi:MAG: YHS domain-containing (seleno)protein [bacterium]
MRHSLPPTHPIRALAAGLLPLLALVLFAGTAHALDPINKTWFGDLAVKGYDPVAYFNEGKPVEGSEAYEYEWKDATWRFANAENRAEFIDAPEKFAPQYGGYCAYAVSQGVTADIDPEAWKIVNGKLYLNVSQSIQRTWERSIKGYIRKADANWPRILKEG